MSPWVIIGIFFISSIAIGTHQAKEKAFKKKLQKLNNRSPKVSYEQYLASFVKLGYPNLHIEILYTKLLELIDKKKFNFHPEDDIASNYFRDGLDDVELMDSTCKELILPLASQEDIDYIATSHKVFNTHFILDLLAHIASKKNYTVTA